METNPMQAVRAFFGLKKLLEKLPACPWLFQPIREGQPKKYFFSILGGKGKYFISNTLFDTTRANIEFSGAEGIDLICEEGKHPEIPAPFKGNMDLAALEKTIQEKGARNIPLCIITVTNNSGGGQPVSMQNIKGVSRICSENKIPLFIDACRFAENSYFIKLRERRVSAQSGFRNRPGTFFVCRWLYNECKKRCFCKYRRFSGDEG